jgi:hypothetical protein
MLLGLFHPEDGGDVSLKTSVFSPYDISWPTVTEYGGSSFFQNGSKYLSDYIPSQGARGSIVVKALCYKPEGRGFETR